MCIYIYEHIFVPVYSYAVCACCSIMYCNTLQHTATHSPTATRVHSGALMFDMTHLRATAHPPTATRIATLCITSTHCNTLWVWCTYMFDITHSRVGRAGDGDKGGAGAGGVQLCSSVDAATLCNTLQHTATHCNTT